MSEGRKKINSKDVLVFLRGTLNHLLLHNGWLKLVAILISLVLWAGLVSQDESLTRDKTFQNVNVSVVGTETMKSNRFIVVSDISEALKDVTAVAAVPQKQYENAEASAYNLRLDLSRINGTGEQEVKLLSTNSTVYGKVVSIQPSSITVNVEEYTARQRIPVSVSPQGEVPEGWYMSTPTADPALIAVSGPRSIVESIYRAKVFLNTDEMEWEEGVKYTSAKIHLYDRTLNEIENSLLNTSFSSVSIDTVLIETNILPMLSFDTTELVQVTGNASKGYEIKNVKISPEIITVAARNEVLEQLDELPMERTCNVRNMSETKVFTLKVQKPSDDAVISNDTVTVTVEIGPIK